MARPRLPEAKAKAIGADIKNPDRFSGRSEPKTQELGGPSDWMVGKQRIAWDYFKREMPWLQESDRTLVEIASCLRARLMTGGEIGVQALAQLRMCVSSMGGTPADRSKVSVPDGNDADPAAEFLN